MLLYRKDQNKYQVNSIHGTSNPKIFQVNFSAFHSMYDVETPLCSARCKNKVAKIVNFTQLHAMNHGFKLRWISCVNTIFRELDRFFQEKRDRKRSNLVSKSIIFLDRTFLPNPETEKYKKWFSVGDPRFATDCFSASPSSQDQLPHHVGSSWSSSWPWRIIITIIIIMTMKDHHDHHHHDNEGSSSSSPPCRTINTIVVTFFLVQADCELQPITINMHYKRAAKVTFELLENYNSF